MAPTHPNDPLEVVTIDGVTVCRFRRRSVLDQEVGDRLFALVEQEKVRKLLLNVGRVESLPTAVSGRFVKLRVELERFGGRLAFCHVEGFLRIIFEQSRLTDQFVLYPDEAAGVAALNAEVPTA